MLRRLPFTFLISQIAIALTALGTLRGEEIPLLNPAINGEGIAIAGGNGAPIEAKISGGTNGTPGVSLQPANGKWDFSAHSRIEATISNMGETRLPVSLRVDNEGDWRISPWSSETIWLNPGDTKSLVVFFGYSYGWKPSFALDTSAVTQLLFFSEGAEKDRAFSILSVSTAGAPDETPDQWNQQVAQTPENNIIFDENTALQPSQQFSVTGGATAIVESAGLSLSYSENKGSVSFRPLSGLWDLRQANHVEVTIKNEGSTPIQPMARVDSYDGSTASVAAGKSISPGESGNISIPFALAEPWDASENPGSGVESGGTGFDSRRASSLTFFPGETQSPTSFRVTRILATAPPAGLPAWIGTLPPVKGEWDLSFREEFNATQLDESKWNVYTENYWDERSHFSRENVLLRGTSAQLRFEKKEGHSNDDPGEKTTPYATGFLDTFGKWTQRYGYFEARLKLPDAPGLWPAFWMMPDRGPSEAPRWKREQTTNGGMEFDIMEYLSGWGPYRYNVAFHWDGYDQSHKSSGTSGIYYQRDSEGFITVGMLWLPGEVVYYCNGKPVGRWASERVSDVPSVLRFTHVSGGWDNVPIDDAKLPSDFEIDYVRVWQRRDLKE